MSDLVEQDVEQDSTGKVSLKQGVSKNRIISVHDPEMRHGRKNKSNRFDGHKGTIAVDTETKLITATDVIAGSASDAENALALCQQSEKNAGSEVETALGDTAYGSGESRKEFAGAGINLITVSPEPTQENIFRVKLVLFLRIQKELGEEGLHRFRVLVLNSDGGRVLETPETPMQFGRDKFYSFILNIQNIPISKYDSYSFELLINGENRRSLSVEIKAPTTAGSQT